MSNFADTWLIFDCHNLCWRKFHALPDLTTAEAVPSSVVFGMLQDIRYFARLFGTERIVFCFDSGYDGRTEIFPGYKVRERQSSERPKVNDELSKEKRLKAKAKEKARAACTKQMNLLRAKHLPNLGFNNVLWQDGYEADDVIASVCKTITDMKGDAIIISSDQDYYQLLSKRVLIYNPKTKKITNVNSFKEKYGIHPSQWAMVKAIGGCSSDKIPGVQGVAEKTAIKYLTKKLPASTAAWHRIKQNEKLIDRNLQLVTLPFPGVNTFELQPDTVNKRSWDNLLRLYNIKIKDLQYDQKGKRKKQR